MKDLSKVGKFSKTFYKLGDFTAKHVINITNYSSSRDDTKKEVSRNPIYVYDVFDKRINESKTCYSLPYSSDSIVLANNAKEVQTSVVANKEGESQKNGYCFITPRDFDKVMDALDKCVSWLCDEEYEKLFTVDTAGNTVGVTENNEVALARFRQGWIMFKPAVIFDQNGAGYQGIYVKSDRGVLASLTGSEFKEFYNYMKEIINNFYQCGLALYNAGLMSMILYKE